MNSLTRRAGIGAFALASVLSTPLVSSAAVDGSAKAVGDAVWQNVLAQCGDGVVYAPRADGSTIVMLRGLKFSSSAETLSDADRQAGVEWEGQFSVRAQFFKLFVPTSVPVSTDQPPRGEWGIWRENIAKYPIVRYELRKVRGRWEIAFADGPGNFVPLDAGNFPLWRTSCHGGDDPSVLAR